jgi:hypothetical protein
VSNDPFNILRAVGPADELERFKQAALANAAAPRQPGGPPEVFGLPDAGPDVYGSRLLAEGQDWILYGFFSASEPPHRLVQAASEEFPALVLLLTYKEDGIGYRGREVYRAGQLLAECDGAYGAEGEAYYDQADPLPDVFAPYFNERKTRNLPEGVAAYGGRCHVCGHRMLQADHPDKGYALEACDGCGYAAGEYLHRDGGRPRWLTLTPHHVWRVVLSSAGGRDRFAIARRLNLPAGPGSEADHFWPSVFRHDLTLRRDYEAALATPGTANRHRAAADAKSALDAFAEGRLGVAITRAHEAAEADPVFAPLRARLMRLAPSPLHLLPRTATSAALWLLYTQTSATRLDRKFGFEVEDEGGRCVVRVRDRVHKVEQITITADDEEPDPSRILIDLDEQVHPFTEPGQFLADVLEAAGVAAVGREPIVRGDRRYLAGRLLRRDTYLPESLQVVDPDDAVAAEPEVETVHNNSACLSACGVCHSQFKPAAGDWPFLKGTWDPVCLSCDACVAAGLRLMEILPAGPSVMLEDLPYVPLAPVLHPHGLGKLQFVCSAESAAKLRAAAGARPADFEVARDEPANALDLEAALSLNPRLAWLPHLFEAGRAPESLSPPYICQGELLAYLTLPPQAAPDERQWRGFDWVCLRCERPLLYIEAEPCMECNLCPGCCPCNEYVNAAARPARAPEPPDDGLPF